MSARNSAASKIQRRNERETRKQAFRGAYILPVVAEEKRST